MILRGRLRDLKVRVFTAKKQCGSVWPDKEAWMKKLLLWLLGETRFATIEQLHEAFFAEEVKFVPSPKGGWANREDHIRFLNNRISIFYHYCDSEYGSNVGKEHESIDLFLKGRSGGVWAIYYGYKLSALTLNAHRIDLLLLDSRQKSLLDEILSHLRKIRLENNIEMPR